MKQLVFAALVVAAHALFFCNLARFTRVVMLGRAANLPETWGQRLASLMAFFFGQRKVMEEKASWHHLPIYWGFLVITITTTEMLIVGLVGEWFDFGMLIGGTAYGWLRTAVDVSCLIVLATLIYAFYRRLVIKPRFIPANLDAMLILGAISLLMLTHFGHHAWRMAAVGAVDPSQPISSAIARTLGLVAQPGVANVDPVWAHVAAEAHWWAHMGIVLGFLNYLPFSKHIHVLGSGPNILLRDQGQRGVMPKLELSNMENWGVGKIEDFTWKSLLDNYACTECARCTNYCPAFATQKPLSPMHLIHDLKDEMKERGFKVLQLQARARALGVEVEAPAPGIVPIPPDPGTPEHEAQEARAAAWEKVQAEPANKPAIDEIERIKAELAGLPPLVGGRVDDATLWACTTCGACQEVCPVFIDHPLKILQMRTHIVLNDEGGRTPGELSRTFQKIENSGNPWGLPQSERMKWAEGLELPRIEDNPDAEYLLFVGCAGAYSDVSKKATRALVRCLQAAGVSFAVLGEKEKCNGDTLRRGGNEASFQALAAENVELMNGLGVKKIIASCPHCFHTLKHEYPQFGGKYEVIHHSKLVAHLLESGKLRVDAPLAKKMTYHDSCYIGRWNGIYDAPREAIARAQAGKADFVELGRNKKHGFCCGAGGARMWMEEEPAKRVNLDRAKEIVASGAQAVAVACPFCKTMVSDGVKHYDRDDIEVMDIAEVVAAVLAPPAARPGPEAQA
jgi:Fe-S oxidoreductase